MDAHDLAGSERAGRKKSNLRRRKVLALLLLSLTGFGLLCAYLYRDPLAEYAIRRLTGLEVGVEGLSLGTALKIDTFQLYATPGHRSNGEATVRGEALEVDYSLLPGDGRRLDAIRIRELELDLERTTVEALRKTLGGGRPRRGRPSSRGEHDGNPLAYVPRTLRVDACHLRGRDEAGHTASFGPVSISAQVDGVGDISAAIQGGDVRGEASLPGTDQAQQFGPGTVDITAQWAGGKLAANRIAISLPGAVEVNGRAEAALETLFLRIETEWERIEVHGAAAGPILNAFSPIPVAFDLAEVSSGPFVFGMVPRQYLSGSGQARVTVSGLRAGPEEMLYYEGDLRIDADLTEEGLFADAVLTQGQLLHARFSRPRRGVRVTFEASEWSRAEFEGAVPGQWRPLLDTFPGLATVSFQGSCQLRPGRYAFDGGAEIIFAKPDGAADAVTAEVSLMGPLDPFIASGSLKLGGAFGRIESSLEIDSAPAVSAGMELYDVVLPESAQLANAWPLPPDWRGAVSGQAGLYWNEQGLMLTSALSLAEAELGGVKVPEGMQPRFEGAVKFAPDWTLVSSPALALALEGTAAVDLEQLRFDTAGPAFESGIEGSADLGPLVQAFSSLPLEGHAEWSGDLAYTNDRLTGSVFAETSELGYGGFSVPSWTPLSAEGGFAYTPGSGQGNLDGLTVRWPPGTSAAAETLAFRAEPFEAEGTVVLQTDLLPLLDLGYLAAVEGSAEAEGTMVIDDGGLGGDYALQLAAPSLMLPGETAVLAGVSMRGGIQGNEGAWNGSGDIGLAEILAGGATVTGFRGKWMLMQDMVRIEEGQASLYGGTVSLKRAEFRFEEAGTVYRAVTAFDGLDLDRLTTEYELPDARMTGLGGGSAVVEYGPEGWREIRVELQAAGNFSVQRGLVEQLLLSEYMTGYTGARRLDKITRDIIGSDEQRPFESGRLTLRLEGEALKGKAQLESDRLNLTVNLNVDLSEVVRALEFHQESQLENLDEIRAEPLQWVE